MSWGLQNRLAQIINPETGKTVLLAIDHGYFMGPVSGLEDPAKTVADIIQYCDALSPTKGILHHSIDPNTSTPMILRASGGGSMARRDPENKDKVIGLEDEVITCTAEEAVSLNAAGVTISIYVGTEMQRQSIDNLATMTREAHKYGLPVIGITAVGGELDALRVEGKEAEFAKYLANAARIAAEHGADIVKTYFVGKGHFDKVIGGCPAPIVIAGGKKEPAQQALEFTYMAMQTGAIGVDMGRNIFQSKEPVKMIQAVRDIVHQGDSVDAVMSRYNLKKDD